jgi:hypothetical protein
MWGACSAYEALLDLVGAEIASGPEVRTALDDVIDQRRGMRSRSAAALRSHAQARCASTSYCSVTSDGLSRNSIDGSDGRWDAPGAVDRLTSPT